MKKSWFEIKKHQDQEENDSAIGEVTQYLSRIDLPHLLHQTGGVDPQDLNEPHLQQAIHDFARIEPPEEASIDDLLHGPRPVDQLVDQVLSRAELLFQVTGRSEGFDGFSFGIEDFLKYQMRRMDLLLDLGSFIPHPQDVEKNLLCTQGKRNFLVALHQLEIKIEDPVFPPKQIVNRFIDLSRDHLQHILFCQELKLYQNLSQILEGP